MKKRIWSTLLLAGMLAGCGGQDGYRVEGDLKGLAGEVYLNIDGRMADTASVKDGKFVFEGKTERPATATVLNERGQVTTFFLENGRIVLKGDAEKPMEIEITGTLSNERYSEVRRKLTACVDRYMAASSGEEKEAAMASFDSLFWASVDANTDNMLGATLLYQAAQGNEPARVVEAIGRFSSEMRTHPMMKEAERIAGTALRTAVGQPYTDITLPDADGKNVSLSSLVGEGKYVLLDFWASWCGPCREEFPYLAEAYGKYRAKGFDIYGVSLDQDREAWSEAVERYGLVWTNVVADENPNDAAQVYGVTSIPANFLIAPDGKIVARDLRGEALAKKLAEWLE